MIFTSGDKKKFVGQVSDHKHTWGILISGIKTYFTGCETEIARMTDIFERVEKLYDVVKSSDGRLTYSGYYDKDVKEYISLMRLILSKKGFTVEQLTKSWFTRFSSLIYPSTYGTYGHSFTLTEVGGYCRPSKDVMRKFLGKDSLSMDMIKPEDLKLTDASLLEFIALLCCPFYVDISIKPYTRQSIGPGS